MPGTKASPTGHIGTERLSLDQALESLPSAQVRAQTVLGRIETVIGLPAGAALLDIGCAQGQFLIACTQRGHRAAGVEPWGEAREVAREVQARLGTNCEIAEGLAERIPYPDESFDLVHANFVMEHVIEIERAFAEAYRVLKPGGIFWFSTASSLCPKQGEIRGFPAFPWYPGALKKRVMDWVMEHRPELVGHTPTPAVNWFTPWKSVRLLRQAGFGRIYDRWDLRLPSEGGKMYQAGLKVIQTGPITKFIADILVPECNYAALKPK